MDFLLCPKASGKVCISTVLIGSVLLADINMQKINFAM